MKKLVLTALLLVAGAAHAQTWQQISSGVPAGAVVHFATRVCPNGWLEANGAAINSNTHPELYRLIGGYLPDVRGEFIRSLDNGRGVDAGRALGSYQADEIKSHQHSVTTALAAPGVMPVNGAGAPGGATAAAGGAETRPRNIALLSCIKS